MGKHRREVLAELIVAHGWKCGAELGVYDGATFGYLLDNIPHLRLIGVDLWDASASRPKNKVTGESDYSKKPMEACFQLVEKMASQHSDRATIMRMSTLDAAKEIEDRTLDFVFVDADHRTEAVRADITAWRPKLNDNGMMIGHDEDWPSVQHALMSLNIKWNKLPGGVWIECK